MHIGIDISQIIYQGTGVARFTYHLTKSILAARTPHRFTFFFSSLKHNLHADIISEIKQTDHRLVRWYVPPRMLSLMWNEAKWRNTMPVPHEFDLFISSDWTQPPVKIAQKQATIVHDLVFRKMPETVDPLILSTQSKRLSHVVKECAQIWCDSASTKADLRSEYQDISAKVSVNYPGISRLSVPTSARFNYAFKPGEYWFAVGKVEPRKNLKILIEAFIHLIQDPQFAHLSLVIAGPRGWDVDTSVFQHPKILMLGAVSDEDLATLYTHALAFVFPSLYEGFGIPPLEAMTLGCPVIMSNSSSLTEIADERSALYFDPRNMDELVSAMRFMALQPQARQSFIDNGHTNVKRFTHEAYLANMLESIEEL